MAVVLIVCILLLVIAALAFLGGFVLGHALGVTTALEHTVHLRRSAECKGKWGSEWFFHSDHSPERAGKPVAPEGSSATEIVPGAESGLRIRPYRGPLVPGYFKLLPILGKMEYKIVEWMSLPNDPAGRLSPIAVGRRCSQDG